MYKLIGPDHNTSWFTATSGNDFDAIEVIWDFFEQFEKLSNPETPNAIKIAPNLKNVRFDIFPNPATDKISLSFNNKVAISSIAISNTLGKTLETKIFDKPITKSEFNISDKSPGIYFFQISDTEGNLTVLRFYKK